MASVKDNTVIQRLVKYLQIPSVHPNIDYGECIRFLSAQAEDIGLPYSVYHMVPSVPILVMTWLGTQPDLPACMLVSHMDVVPVVEERWTHPPFEGHVDEEESKIYARGAQDMKSIGMQYLETVRKLKQENITLKRTLHICFSPNEETGGADGMKMFVRSDEFRKLNVGFSLDEGMPSQNDEYFLFYGERTIWHLIINCSGTAGHGSLLAKNTAGEKVRKILDKFMDFRAQELEKLEKDPSLTLGDVTTVNLTQIMGGSLPNVLPEKLKLYFDIRITQSVDIDEFTKMIENWCKESGEGVEMEFLEKEVYVPSTQLNSENIFWCAFKKATEEMNMIVNTRIFPAGTDSQYIRSVGIPALGFSPIINTPMLLHDHNEFIYVDGYFKGIDIYRKIVPAIANA